MAAITKLNDFGVQKMKGNMEVVKQEMARVNIVISGINELKRTEMLNFLR